MSCAVDVNLWKPYECTTECWIWLRSFGRRARRYHFCSTADLHIHLKSSNTAALDSFGRPINCRIFQKAELSAIRLKAVRLMNCLCTPMIARKSNCRYISCVFPSQPTAPPGFSSALL